MQDKFDVKDVFNNIIAGVLWLLLSWQIDFLFHAQSSFNSILNCINKYKILSEIALPVFFIIAFILGVLLRPLESIPLLFFDGLIGDPMDWIFYDEKKNKKSIKQRFCESFKKRYERFFCLNKTSLNDKTIDKVCEYFIEKEMLCDCYKKHNETPTSDKENCKENCKERTNQLIHIQTMLELKQQPKIYERFKNYKNLMESIMLPTMINACLPFIYYLILKREQELVKIILQTAGIILLIVIFIIFIGLLIFNRYKYYKTEFCKQVFRSIDILEDKRSKPIA
jgi:hypothetical protein